MNEWRRILSDKRRLAAILCIPVLCFILFFYQKSNGNFVSLISDAREYRALVENYRDTDPEEIVEELESNWMPSRGEERLLEQAEHLASYGKYLETVQTQANNMQLSSLFNQDKQSFLYRNIIKTAQDFASCTAEGVCLGNDRAVQDWLDYSLADWGFLVAIVVLVMSFLDERKKGLCAIVRTCPAGRAKLQMTRMLVLLEYSVGMTLLLYALPLAVSMCLDGGWEGLSRPVQSLAEFRLCTAQLSISGFLAQFLLVKAACGFLLGVLIWFLLGFLEHVQLSWLMTAAGLVVEYLLYAFIAPHSIFSPLREINVFSYVFTSRLFTQYSNINFFSFPVGRRTLLMGLLAVLVFVLGGITLWVQSRRYPYGNRDWLGRLLHLWNRAGDGLRRHLGLYGFEWYKLLFLGAGGLFLLLGLAMSWDLNCYSGQYNTEYSYTYRQYVAQIQGPVTQDTFDYLEKARQALEHSYVDTYEFEEALDQVDEAVASLEDGAWLVDDTYFLNIYGPDAWMLQSRNALTAMIILAASLSALYACEDSGDVRKILHSTPGGRSRLFWAKYAVAVSVALLVWLMVFVREWVTAAELLGDVVLNAPCSSIALIKAYPMSVKTFLCLLYAGKALGLVLLTSLCVCIGERCRGFEKAFLLSGVILLFPAAAYSFGAHALGPVTLLSCLSDGNPLLSGGTGLAVMAVWAALSALALFAARRSWCQEGLPVWRRKQ